MLLRGQRGPARAPVLLTKVGAVKVTVSVDVGSTFLQEQALDSPDSASALSVFSGAGRVDDTVPLSMTDEIIWLAVAALAAIFAARGRTAAGVVVLTTVSVVIVRIVLVMVEVALLLVVVVLPRWLVGPLKGDITAYNMGV